MSKYTIDLNNREGLNDNIESYDGSWEVMYYKDSGKLELSYWKINDVEPSTRIEITAEELLNLQTLMKNIKLKV